MQANSMRKGMYHQRGDGQLALGPHEPLHQPDPIAGAALNGLLAPCMNLLNPKFALG